MLGYFNYTELLTYLSLISASCGIIVSLNYGGHPYYGVFFLMFCGLCDAFDGKVARTKKDRSIREQKFGIQIDSLSDLVAFGVLPGCIGNALIKVNPAMSDRISEWDRFNPYVVIVLFVIIILYILAAMIRLAYFNVLEEERQNTETGARKSYTGLPVTSAALIFPTIMLAQFATPHYDITWLYFVMLGVVGLLFLSKINIKKPGLKGILIMVAVGAAEAIALLLCNYFLT